MLSSKPPIAVLPDAPFLYLTVSPVLSPLPEPTKMVSPSASTTGTVPAVRSTSRSAITACTLSPPARIVVSVPMYARLLTLTTFTATPTPTPVPPSPVVAEPSAIACPSVFAADFTVKVPPAVTWR